MKIIFLCEEVENVGYNTHISAAFYAIRISWITHGNTINSLSHNGDNRIRRNETK